MGRRVRLMLVLVCSLVAGCAAPELKGTPFFTGEYERSEGRPEDRVNLWPLLYYREPALAVLWPVFERVAGEHVAVRPLLSVHDMDKDHPVVNVLWPLCRFAPGERRNRIFPAYWGRAGDDRPYFVLFPFLWYSKDRHVGLFPLALNYDDGTERSFHALWPLFNLKKDRRKEGWRLWPLYGHYRGEDRSRRYALWPLLMSLRDGDERLRWAAPFYFGKRSPEADWDLLLPVYYRRKDDEGRRTVVTPLYMASRKGEDWWRFVAPSYYALRRGSEKQDLLFPLYYKWTDGQARMLLTLPYGFKESGESRTIFAFPLLSAYGRSPEHKDLWAVYPLSHWQWNEQGVQESHVFPFYYWRRSDGLFLSPLYSSRRQEGKGFVNVLGPLFHKSWRDSARSVNVLWPLIGAKSKGDGSESYARFLYSYRRRGDRKRLQLGPSLGDASLVGRRWSERDRSWWVFPIFGGGAEKTVRWSDEATVHEMDVRRRHFVAFPLVWHWSCDPLEGTEQELPPPESGRGPRISRKPDSEARTFVLPLWGYWREGLVAGEAQGTGKKGFWLLGPLYDFQKRVTEREDASGELDTYVRHRVLWRLMHYERRNEQTTLDVFPGITYDKTPGRKKTFSLLWRVFRYEWDKETGTKVHVLFIPFGG